MFKHCGDLKNDSSLRERLVTESLPAGIDKRTAMLEGYLEALTALLDRVTSEEEANFDCRAAWLRRIY